MNKSKEKKPFLAALCDNRNDRGFTLIEVIVAMLMLGICITLIMELFSAGLRTSRASCDYTRAVLHAKDRMEELSVFLVPGSGDFGDGYEWESTVEMYKEVEDIPSKLMKLKVEVYWGVSDVKKKSLELVSLKLVADEENL